MTGNARRVTHLTPGGVTGVGSLPHADATAAVDLVTRLPCRLPFAPQLPHRSPLEGMLVQWLRGLPEVAVAPDGSFTVDGSSAGSAGAAGAAGDPVAELDAEAHGGLLAFLDACAGRDPAVVKLQVTGPLTLGMGLVDAGMEPARAFARAGRLVDAWIVAVLEACAAALPHAAPVLFVDEPSLVAWRDGEPPLAREDAVDLLSAVLASVPAVTGVHVCGDGDRRMAFEAGPDIVGFTVHPSVLDDGVPISRFLDAGGWIAWGAVPTDRPVGERADHWWTELVSLWCDLTRGGCDPAVLRTQSLITPACGLAGHTEAQAERILSHCVEIGERVREQAIATRLSVGA